MATLQQPQNSLKESFAFKRGQPSAYIHERYNINLPDVHCETHTILSWLVMG